MHPHDDEDDETPRTRSSLADDYRRRRRSRGAMRFLLPLGLIVLVCVGVGGFVVLKLSDGKTSNPLNALHRVNPPLDSIQLDEVIIIEGQMAGPGVTGYYETIFQRHLRADEHVVSPPESLKYQVFVDFRSGTDTRKLTWKGGPKLVRVRGKVRYTSAETVRMTNCVDLSDY